MVFSYPVSMRRQSTTCGVELCVDHWFLFVFFLFLLLLKGLMGPEGKDGPPGLQGLRVSNVSFPSNHQLSPAGAPSSVAQTEDVVPASWA